MSVNFSQFTSQASPALSDNVVGYVATSVGGERRTTLAAALALFQTNSNLSGDVTSVGLATSIAANVIVNADVNSSAAIAYSKLNLGTSIVNADISASAAIVDTKLAQISTASKVSNSATTASALNTASAIVARDASGNFSAGTISAALTGNVTGNVSGSSGSTTGNAATATALATGRTIAITGDLAYTSPSFDGSGNVTAAGTLASVASAGTSGGSTAIPVVTINAKGLTTSITTAAVIAPAGTLTGATLASGVTASSLTSLGTIANLTATAGTITTTPTASTDIANKLYVDTVAQGLDAKASCVAATTANITLSGTQTIDGISVIAGNRVLVKNQTLSQDNGIYLCASGAWTRTTDADTWDELTSAFTFIEQGTVNADCGFVCTANAGGTLGTTALPWSQFSGAGSYTASTGLTLTGTVFSLTAPVTVALGGTNATSAGIAAFNNISGFTAAGATGTTSTNLVFSTSPTLITPALGTPTAIVLTSATGLPLTTGVTGTLPVANGGTGVTTSTGTTNVVLSGSPTITTPVIAQINDASGNETLKLASIASAVNEVTIENAATGNAVHISATGGDASVGLHLAGKGASGYVNVQDSTDATKRIMFNAAGGTTNTRTMLSSTQTVDRTLSLPDATDTLVGVAATQTLTNKTLTSPTLTAPILGTPASGTVTNLTGTASININGTVGATTANTGAFTTISSTAGANFATSSGSVGIGTISPNLQSGAKAVTVSGGTSGDNRAAVEIQGSRTTDATFGAVRFYNQTTQAAGITADRQGADDTASLAFYTKETSPGVLSQRLSITAAGNVGIGTASPAYKLDISNATDLKTLRLVGPLNTVGSGPSLALFENINIDSTPAGFDIFLESNSNRFDIRSYSNSATPVERLSILRDSGNVGIGTTSPAQTLSVVGTLSATGTVTIANSAANVGLDLGSFNGAAARDNTIRIDTAGSSNFATLQFTVGGTNTSSLRCSTAGSALEAVVGSTIIGAFSSTGVAITGTLSCTTGAEFATSAGGNFVKIGSATALGSGTGLLEITFNNAYFGQRVKTSNSGGGNVFQIQKSTGAEVGLISHNDTVTVYGGTSDYRLKNITGAVTDSGTFIDALKPKVGTWKSDGSKFVGFIAHEFAEVSPSSVQGEKDAVDAEGNPKYQGMQASSAEVIANLVAELQSLRKRLSALESK